MSLLTLAALGILGGGLLIVVSVLVPRRMLSRPTDDALPTDGPLDASDAADIHAEEAGA